MIRIPYATPYFGRSSPRENPSNTKLSALSIVVIRSFDQEKLNIRPQVTSVHLLLSLVLLVVDRDGSDERSGSVTWRLERVIELTCHWDRSVLTK